MAKITVGPNRVRTALKPHPQNELLSKGVTTAPLLNTQKLVSVAVCLTVCVYLTEKQQHRWQKHQLNSTNYTENNSEMYQSFSKKMRQSYHLLFLAHLYFTCCKAYKCERIDTRNDCGHTLIPSPSTLCKKTVPTIKWLSQSDRLHCCIKSIITTQNGDIRPVLLALWVSDKFICKVIIPCYVFSSPLSSPSPALSTSVPCGSPLTTFPACCPGPVPAQLSYPTGRSTLLSCRCPWGMSPWPCVGMPWWLTSAFIRTS